MSARSEFDHQLVEYSIQIVAVNLYLVAVNLNFNVINKYLDPVPPRGPAVTVVGACTF